VGSLQKLRSASGGEAPHSVRALANDWSWHSEGYPIPELRQLAATDRDGRLTARAPIQSPAPRTVRADGNLAQARSKKNGHLRAPEADPERCQEAWL
jgi:hypothetical protein